MQIRGKKVYALKVLKSNNQELAITDIIPEDILSDEAKNELNKIKEIEKTVNRENLVYKQIIIHLVLKIFEQ